MWALSRLPRAVHAVQLPHCVKGAHSVAGNSLREDSARQAMGSFICSVQADVLRGLRQPLNNPGVRQPLRHASRGSLVTHPA